MTAFQCWECGCVYDESDAGRNSDGKLACPVCGNTFASIPVEGSAEPIGFPIDSDAIWEGDNVTVTIFKADDHEVLFTITMPREDAFKMAMKIIDARVIKRRSRSYQCPTLQVGPFHSIYIR